MLFTNPYREAGIVVKADTIEELAEKLGLPVEQFKATVDRYNELFDQQKDEDFGKEAYRLSQLRKAPFEGIRLSGGYLINTMDGIKIDENMNAVDTEGEPIEGLYVAGDCSGGYFATSYPNLLAGCAAGRASLRLSDKKDPKPGESRLLSPGFIFREERTDFVEEGPAALTGGRDSFMIRLPFVSNVEI